MTNLISSLILVGTITKHIDAPIDFMAQHETYNFLDPKYMEHDFRMPPETCIFKAVYTYGANIPFESVDVDMTTDNIVTNIDLIDYHGTIQIGTNFFKLTNQ